MRVVLIRHAIAVPAGTPGVPDAERPLTPRGKRRFHEAARGLARVLRRPDTLLTSPLPRALATAEIAARAWGRVRPTAAPALAHGSLDDLLGLLAGHPEEATVVLVGHEPSLSALLARLLGSPVADRLGFRKGGAALVKLAGAPAHGGGRLVWYLPPKIMRALGRD